MKNIARIIRNSKIPLQIWRSRILSAFIKNALKRILLFKTYEPNSFCYLDMCCGWRRMSFFSWLNRSVYHVQKKVPGKMSGHFFVRKGTAIRIRFAIVRLCTLRLGLLCENRTISDAVTFRESSPKKSINMTIF